jgi:hypothetical protein
MTDGIIKTTPATTDVAVYDPRNRDFFRGFGQFVGNINQSSLGKLEIWIFGDIVEVHGDGLRVKAEFSIKPLIHEAIKQMGDA